MGETNGNRGGKPRIVGTRLTNAQGEDFDRKRAHLSQSEACRLALLEWGGVRSRPTDPQ